MSLIPATLAYEGDTPYSTQYGDTYYAQSGGLAETRYVFLDGNHLPARFENHAKETFTVLETDFGTGLNFLATWDAFNQTNTSTSLHFVSVEKHPFTHADLNRIFQHRSYFSALEKTLLDGYPQPMPSAKNSLLLDERVLLTLLCGDVLEMLPAWDGYADAIYLDGFAPAKNPEMWQPAVFNALYKKSRIGTTLATFTAASEVRKNLIAAGFNIEKRKGFGHKREMLIGTRQTIAF